MPVVSNLTSDPILSDALALMPAPRGTHQGDYVLPRRAVNAERVKYIARTEHKLNLDNLRAARAEAKMIEIERGELKSISLEEHAFKTRLDQREIRAYLSDPEGGSLVNDALAEIAGDVADVKEHEIASLVTDDGNYDGDHVFDGANFASTTLLSDASEGIHLAQDRIADNGDFLPDHGLIGRNAKRVLQTNTALQKWAGGVNGTEQDVTLAAIAEWFGLVEVREARYKRKIGNDSSATEFWPLDFFLMFKKADTISTRTFGRTAVLPYQNGQDIDVRRVEIPTTDELVEVGAYHLYAPAVLNWDLAVLYTGITNT